MLGEKRFPVSVKAGNDENPGSSLKSTDIACAKRDRHTRIAEPFQFAHDLVDPELCAACDILDDNPFGAARFDDASELTPKTRALSNKTRAISRGRNVLAWEASTDEVDPFKLAGFDLRDVFILLHTWPVFREHHPAERIDLTLPNYMA